MKMSKNYKRICLTLALGVALSATVVDAANYTKSLKATYKDISVVYNGASKTLSNEPFLVDGSTYVPLRAVSEIMGADVKWDGSSSTVTINDSSSSNASAQAELAAKNYQITVLQRQVDDLTAELATYKNSNNSSSSNSDYTQTSGTDILGTELTATENYLISEYAEYFDDIEFDFDVSRKSSYLKVEISYDTKSENEEFDDLSDKKLKDFLEELCADIRDRHDDIVIEGVINYTRGDVDKCSFSYSKKDKLTYAKGSGLEESDVTSIVKKAGGVEIDGYNNYITISKVDANVSDSGETITFKIYMSLTSADIEAWNKYLGTNNDTSLRNYLEDIAEDIEEEAVGNCTIDGVVYDSSNNLVATYDFDDNKLVKSRIN